jgi:hypothetical protein
MLGEGCEGWWCACTCSFGSLLGGVVGASAAPRFLPFVEGHGGCVSREASLREYLAFVTGMEASASEVLLGLAAAAVMVRKAPMLGARSSSGGDSLVCVGCRAQGPPSFVRRPRWSWELDDNEESALKRFLDLGEIDFLLSKMNPKFTKP